MPNMVRKVLITGWKLIAPLAVFMAVVPAAPAWANPAVGSGCDSGQLNQTTVSSAGNTVRCLAYHGCGYIWQADTGVTQSPEQAAGMANLPPPCIYQP
jgi:hypothetical protein